MKLARLLDENLHSALKRLGGQQLPLKAAFALKGINKKIHEELAKYEETRKEALQKYGNRDENGELVVSPEGNVDLAEAHKMNFVKELNELLNLDVDVGSVSVDSFGEAKLSAEDMMALDGLIN